jgi:hypothetical protein
MKSKVLLSAFLFFGMVLCTMAQDTISLYLDSDFNSTEIENASYVRNVVILESLYYVTDRKTNGVMVNYGEYKSANPWIEEGLSIHYDDEGNKYSVGNYVNGDLSGKWLYFEKEKVDTVNYELDLSILQSFDCNKINSEKNRNKLKRIGTAQIDSITGFINRNFHFPARTKSQIKSFTQAIDLTLDIDGKVKCPKFLNFIDKDLSLELLRILLQYNSQVEVLKPIQLSFFIEIREEENIIGNEIFTIVQNMPRFNYLDCNDTFECLYKFISDSLRVPNDNCEGKAFVNFVVERDGTVSNIQILRGIEGCPGYAAEIERLLKSMPAWIPGKQKGVAVRVRHGAFISFKKKIDE